MSHATKHYTLDSAEIVVFTGKKKPNKCSCYYTQYAMTCKKYIARYCRL